MTMWAENTAGMHNLFRLSSLASLEGYFYKPRMDRELLHTYAQGPDRHHRLPVGGGADLPAARPVRRGAGQRGRVPRHLRRRQLLRRADGPRAVASRTGSAPTCCRLRQGPQAAAGRHQRPALRHAGRRRRPRGAALRPVRLDHGRREPVQVRGRRLLPEVAGRDAGAVRRAARGLRQHPGHRRALRHLLHRGQRHLHAALPLPAGGERGAPGSCKEVETGLRRRYPTGHPGRGPHAGRVRDRRHHLDGLRRLLPGRRRLHQLGQGERHPGRPGPRLGRRVDGRVRDADHRPRPAQARADLRAVPQPRPGLDARLRHRLRRASPRRGDPLRHREVRRGPGQPDRHLRHDQGQAGGQGRLPGARLPVRDGGAAHQGDAAAGDGQGRPAGQALRPRAHALRRGRGVPGALRVRRRRPDGRRHRPGPGGPEAAVGRARGRRDHVQRAADRHHPDHAPRAGRRDHHPVRLPDVRVAGPDQDGLPRAAEPHRARRRGGQHQAQPRLRPGAGGPAAGRPGRRTRCSAAATRSGCSSSTAGRCARCCG